MHRNDREYSTSNNVYVTVSKDILLTLCLLHLHVQGPKGWPIL